MNQRDYMPAGPVIREFHRSNAFVRSLMGPIGSGKSTACAMELLRRAAQQAPSLDGIRRFRAAIIRPTYPELRTTTLKTWLEWCPPEFGKLTYDSPITHRIKTDVLDLEILFLALDREEDARKLLSLELTAAWINESREASKAIIDMLTGRVGRYPSKNLGGCSWSGIIMDTNPPDTESWLYKLAEEDRPANWAFFKQPSGLSTEAENVGNLPHDYYTRLLGGKSDDWIKCYIHGSYAFVVEGKAVYPNWRDSVHVTSQAFEPVPSLALMIGIDFGLTPSAVIGQRMVDGRWLILDEIVADNVGIGRFGETLSAYVRQHYPDHDIAAVWGDPAGNQRAQTDETTALEILAERTGWRCKPAPSNDITMRLECVKGALNRMVDGRPGFVLSPKCSALRKGFSGGYHYKSVRTAKGSQFHETPAKNQYSHPHDALQYLLLGGGEADVVMNKIARHERRQGPRIAHGTDYNPLDRGSDQPQAGWSLFEKRYFAPLHGGSIRRSGVAKDVDYNPFSS